MFEPCTILKRLGATVLTPEESEVCNTLTSFNQLCLRDTDGYWHFMAYNFT